MRKDRRLRDIEVCRDKIRAMLKEYNCDLISAEEYHGVLIIDLDTHETLRADR